MQDSDIFSKQLERHFHELHQKKRALSLFYDKWRFLRSLGMLVWQDFVQMFSPPVTNTTTEAQFELEAMRVVTVRDKSLPATFPSSLDPKMDPAVQRLLRHGCCCQMHPRCT